MSCHGGSKSEPKKDPVEAEWILPAECDGPYLQVSVKDPPGAVRALGKDFYKNDQGRAFYNFTLDDVGAAATFDLDLAGTKQTVTVPAKPTFPYKLIAPFVGHTDIGHWSGKATLGSQTWDVKADAGADGALRFPLPCGTTAAKSPTGADRGRFEVVERRPSYALPYAETLLDSALDAEHTLAFDLAIDGQGGPATLAFDGQISVSQLLGGSIAAELDAGLGLAWAPLPSKGAPMLFVLNGYALPDLLHGASVREAATVAVATVEDVEIEPCHYDEGRIVGRSRVDTHVTVYAAHEGKKLGAKSVRGAPAKCPRSITETTLDDSASQDVDHVRGEPDLAAAEKWAARAAR